MMGRQRIKQWIVSTLVGAGLMLAACSADSGASSRGPTGETPGTGCAPDNATQACVCSDSAPGRQVCGGGAWSQCECDALSSAGTGAAAIGGAGVSGASGASGSGGSAGVAAPLPGSDATDPVANKSSARFDWARTVPTGGSCEAGHYEGTFDGFYGPSIIVVSGLKVIPVFPVPQPDGSTGLAFDLARAGSGEVLTVSGGKMHGNALGAFPFTADIVGTLDCTTGKFDAMLVNGSYFIGPLEYKFEGPIIADYDKQTHTLKNGTWMVTEPAYPTAGGSGTWTVTWKP